MMKFCHYDTSGPRLSIPEGGHVHYMPENGVVWIYCDNVRIRDVDNHPHVVVVPHQLGDSTAIVREEYR